MSFGTCFSNPEWSRQRGKFRNAHKHGSFWNGTEVKRLIEKLASLGFEVDISHPDASGYLFGLVAAVQVIYFVFSGLTRNQVSIVFMIDIRFILNN